MCVLISEVEYNIDLIYDHIHMWDPYMHIWKVDKNDFMAQYRAENHTAADFDALIISYSNLANAVQIQETFNQVTYRNGIKLKYHATIKTLNNKNYHKEN